MKNLFNLCLVMSLHCVALLGICAGEQMMPTGTYSNPQDTVIEGVVWNSTHDIHVLFDRWDAMKFSNEKEMVDAWKRAPSNDVVANLDIFIEGDGGISRKTTSDQKGNFLFKGIPPGRYKVFASMTKCPTGTKGVYRDATAVCVETFSSGKSFVKLMLRNDLLIVKGRVTSIEGKGLANVRVHATDGLEETMGRGLELDTLTSKEGYYEFKNLEPANWYNLTGCLLGGNTGARGYLEITANCAGYVSHTNNPQRIMRVTSDQLEPARRLLKIYNDINMRSSGKGYAEHKTLLFPKSEGIIVTVPDIVMKPEGGKDTRAKCTTE